MAHQRAHRAQQCHAAGHGMLPARKRAQHPLGVGAAARLAENLAAAVHHGITAEHNRIGRDFPRRIQRGIGVARLAERQLLGELGRVGKVGVLVGIGGKDRKLNAL